MKDVVHILEFLLGIPFVELLFDRLALFITTRSKMVEDAVFR